MKRIVRLIVLAIIIIGGYLAYTVFGSNTGFEGNKAELYIKTGSNFDDVMNQIKEKKILRSTGVFKMLAEQTGYTNRIRPGKYVITNGSSLFSIFRKLRSGSQSTVNLVITKLRTKEEFIQKLSENFEADKIQVATFINNNDSLKEFGVDTNTVMSMVLPDTYSYYWTTSTRNILRKIHDNYDNFWDEQKKQKASAMGLTPVQVSILASIVEEETNFNDDKGKVASVYLNRLHKGMKLAADPTVKFAMKNFELKRIYHQYLDHPSPYNTYRYAGLPPGPICTPSYITIKHVLDAPKTDYLFFVAEPNLSGKSVFTTNYVDHMKYAKQYQTWLDEYMKTQK